MAFPALPFLTMLAGQMGQRQQQQQAQQANRPMGETFGAPDQAYNAMIQAKAEEEGQNKNAFGLPEPEWKKKAEYVALPHHIGGDFLKKKLGLPL